MNDPMDTLLRTALAREPRPELTGRFTEGISDRIRTTPQVRRSIRLLLTTYWIATASFALAEIAQVSWPSWLLTGSLLLMPLLVALMILAGGPPFDA